MAQEREPTTDRDGNPTGVVPRAQKNFDFARDFEQDARKHWLDDYKFANADAYNGYQWPNEIRKTRDVDARPTLTINKTRQHCLQIINDAKQNKPGIKFRATGGGASFLSAQMYDATARHIEYQSSASLAYDMGMSFMVQAGFGWLRLRTDYADSETFNQEIFIDGVADPLTVYVDPEATGDKLNASWGLVFEDMLRDKFVAKWPRYKEYANSSPLKSASNWISDKKIRVAEYYEREEIKDKIYAVRQPDGTEVKVLRRSALKKSDPTGELVAALEADPELPKRDVVDFKVNYYLIAGEHEIREERKVWPGKYIPLIRVVAEETQIEGKYDAKSHTRALLDPQRMYNYWSSAAVEYGALQGKTPWITAIEAIEGYETYWRTANTVNHAYLPFNGLDDQGNAIPPPKRTDPPVAAPVCLEGMRIAQTEMMLVSGQYESVMGQGSNERSGKAINERQRAGENATYHFINGMGNALRALGKQLMDLVPKVYDTKRLIAAMGEDGKEFELLVDPQAQQAVQKREVEQQAIAQRIVFNPNVGKYDVEADIGPAYGTKRQETFNALTLILTQAPQLTGIIGDLLLRSSDFHLADEAAERLRRMVPKYALGEGPSQSEQALMAQVQNLNELLAKAMEELSLAKIQLKGKEQLRDVDVFNALTQRLKVLADAAVKSREAEGQSGELGEDELRLLAAQAVQETLSTSLQPIVEANAPVHEANAEQNGGLGGLVGSMGGNLKPPVPGAKLAPNGQWYFPKDVSQSKTAIPVV